MAKQGEPNQATNKYWIPFLNLVVFGLMSTLFYYFDLPELASVDLFLTISTFSFAIFTGFFISRQGRRYNDIRNRIGEFDGIMSTMYRQFTHFGPKSVKEVEKVIKAHYKKILNKHGWDYHIDHKSTTITDLNALVGKYSKKKRDISGIEFVATDTILKALEKLQVIRKQMVLLHQERIPQSQWGLLYFLAFVLLLALLFIPSEGFLAPSILKGAFGSSIIFVLVLLHRLDTLKFFENIIGEESARDVMDILAGRK